MNIHDDYVRDRINIHEVSGAFWAYYFHEVFQASRAQVSMCGSNEYSQRFISFLTF